MLHNPCKLSWLLVHWRMLLSHRTNHDHLFHTLSILLLSNSWKERRSGSDSHGSNCLGVDYLLLLPWGVSCSRKSIIKVVVPRSSLLRCFPWVILDVCATMSPEHLLLCCSWWVGAWKAWSHLGDLGIDIMYTSQSWLSNRGSLKRLGDANTTIEFSEF